MNLKWVNERETMCPDKVYRCSHEMGERERNYVSRQRETMCSDKVYRCSHEMDKEAYES